MALHHLTRAARSREACCRETHSKAARSGEAGFTVVELSVAMALSLVLLTGLTSIFVNNVEARGNIEKANRQTENGRYALQLLSDELRNAGYLAALDPAPLATPASKPDPCATDLASLKAALPISVQGYDNGANTPSCLSDVRPGTDILVVRRASTCAVGETRCDALVAGARYLQASGCSSSTELSSSNSADYYRLDTTVANLDRHKRDCNPPSVAGTLAPLHQYRTHIYFVANNDRTGDGIPTLKRAELGPSGFTIVPMVEGIENLQIEYGLDTATPKTGAPAVFTAAPDSYATCTGATCVGYWRNTVSAKVMLLARNTTVSAGHTDTKLYSVGARADGTANTLGPFNDAYKRHIYASMVRLNNPAGRNTP